MVDWPIALGSALVGFIVGLTGMGGGALMTPMLVLVFGVDPLTAVSSDLVAAAVMKPVGGAIHSRRGTVQWPLVRCLLLGSVPAAFGGVLLMKQLGDPKAIESLVRSSLGAALLLVSVGLVLRARVAAQFNAPGAAAAPITLRPLPTLLVGVLGGVIVGMTSVGSGSLMILGLLLLYPRLRLSDLVGTDLVQAVPLVASAALGHVLFGDFKLELTTSLLIGSLPGVFLGAKLSSRSSDSVIRPALVVVLVASGLKLLGVSGMMVAGASLLTLMAVVGLGFFQQRRRTVVASISAQA
jgi:uncharacterized protein